MLNLKARAKDDSVIEAGVDEAGRGCLWGPLYAGAVVWPSLESLTQEQLEVTSKIKDSKKITPKRRIVLAEQIKQIAISWAVGSVSAKEIDEFGITKSNQLAFTRALDGLQVKPERLLIDGILSIYDQPWSMIEQIVEPELDNTYIAVAAASILAKEEHDKWVRDFCALNTNIAETYGFLSHKGYGTAKHRTAILEHGTHSEHRALFLRKLFAGKATKGDSVLESNNS
jgi:ribonuclease HII